MMAYQHREGRGKAWLNENKVAEPGTNKPRWRGNGMIGGKVWRIAVWEGHDGELSLIFEEPRNEEDKAPPEPKLVAKSFDEVRTLRDELDDDYPDGYSG